MYWPNFRNEFLKNFIFSIKKRSKSLKHKTRKILCDKIIERNLSGEVEKLELRIDLILPLYSTLSVFIWEDRWLWIDARVSGDKDWAWQWDIEGRLVHDSTKNLLACIEDTIGLMPEAGIDTKQQLMIVEFWTKILAKGPEKINT